MAITRANVHSYWDAEALTKVLSRTPEELEKLRLERANDPYLRHMEEIGMDGWGRTQADRDALRRRSGW